MDSHTMHTHSCGELRREHIGQTVTLTGWVWHRRDHGGLIFVDLRDREGVTQVSFDPEHSGGEAFHAAETIRSEWPIKVTGVVRERPEGMENNKIATGEVEVLIDQIEVLNSSKTPPFQIEATRSRSSTPPRRRPSRSRTTWTPPRTSACATATWTCAARA